MNYYLKICNSLYVWIAKWTNAIVLRTIPFGFVGPNPTPGNKIYRYTINLLCISVYTLFLLTIVISLSSSLSYS